jgi:DICT domain-containing protein
MTGRLATLVRGRFYRQRSSVYRFVSQVSQQILFADAEHLDFTDTGMTV